MKQIYLDTASLGLMAPATIAAAQQFSESLGTGRIAKPVLDDVLHDTRSAIKSFLHLSEGMLSFTPPFGYALLQIAASIRKPLKALILSDDYPSFQTIWQDAGHPVFVLEKNIGAAIDYNELFDSVKNNQVGVIIISQVNYRSGRTIDLDVLDQFCIKNDILLIVDATQSIGLLPLDLSDSPGFILLASCYKWLCAGYGLGISYLSPFAQQLIQRNNHSGQKPFNSDNYAEISHYNYDGLIRLKSALEHYGQQSIGIVYDHVQKLVKQMLATLDDEVNQLILAPVEIQSGIVSMVDRPGLFDYLRSHNIRIAQKDGIIRIAPHWYNTAHEIDQVLDLINFYQG